MLLLFGLTQDSVIYTLFATAMLIGFIGFFVIAQPYKVAVYNRTDMFILIPMLLFNVVLIFHIVTLPDKYLLYLIQKLLLGLCLCAPIVYICAWVVIINGEGGVVNSTPIMFIEYFILL